MNHNSTIDRLLNEPDGLRYQGGAVAYAVLADAAGLAGLFHGNLVVLAAAQRADVYGGNASSFLTSF